MTSHAPKSPAGVADRPPKSPDSHAAKLKVSEAASKDVGRAIARLDPDTLRRLGLNIGDAVEVRGKRATVCRAMPSFTDQRGQGRVALDGLSRRNAQAGMDEKVELRPVACKPADTVTLLPTSTAPNQRDLDYIGSLLDGLTVTAGDTIRAALFGSRTADFTVGDTAPAGAVQINPTTRLLIAGPGAGTASNAAGATPRGHGAASAPSTPPGHAPGRLAYEDIGGLGPQMQRIREMIELPLRFPEIFERLGIDPPKGVLLYGPPGCGKTLIARTIAQETNANFYVVSGPEIIHKNYGESEANLRRIFDEATRRGPSIIFIDEIDSIAPKRENTQGEVEKRVVAQLLTLMDGLTKRTNLIVIAATNLPNNIDPALRRPGRFDREIAIPIPDRHGRRQILEIHSRGMPLADDVNLDAIADVAHGCVGADLEAICREAAMACLRTIMDQIDFSANTIPYRQLAALTVTHQHFLSAFNEVEPSAVREVFVEVPTVKWDDIGGLHETKARLTEALDWPLKHAPLFDAAGVKPPKGILLVGPPGVGKTLLAKAAATQSQANFISVKGPELLGKYVGESEKAMREIFRKARQAAPCIVFFDEIDALLPRRGAHGEGQGVAERVMSQFLAEMDGVEDLRGVLVLGATNRLDMLDAAVVRPGRFDRIIELPPPDEAARAEIFRVHLRGKPVAAGIDAADLARRTPAATGAQVASICAKAALSAVRRAVVESELGKKPKPKVQITAEDFAAVIREEFAA